MRYSANLVIRNIYNSDITTSHYFVLRNYLINSSIYILLYISKKRKIFLLIIHASLYNLLYIIKAKKKLKKFILKIKEKLYYYIETYII